MFRHVRATARRGDVDAVIAAMDQFAHHRAFLMNVGEQKGEILEHAVRQAQPGRVLELGSYCGYSGLRIIRALPTDAHLYSIEPSRAHARIATSIWRHAGVADRVTCVRGWLGDHGRTISRLRARHGFSPAILDVLFLDHDKQHYLPDLRRILDQGWLHPGSVVVADNIITPGAPDYHAYMREHENLLWHTTEEHTHLEYHPHIPDLMLISHYLGPPRDPPRRPGSANPQP